MKKRLMKTKETRDGWITPARGWWIIGIIAGVAIVALVIVYAIRGML